MEVKIVLGMAFGDEGKGATVQSLVREAQNTGNKVAVVRFSGGPQAAHTIINDGEKHVCSTYGAGVLLGADTFLTPDVYFDPYCANQERLALEKIGVKEPRILISNGIRTITPWDILYDRQDFVVGAHGTCGKGIHATFVRTNKQVPESVAREWYEKRHGFRSEEAKEMARAYRDAAFDLGENGAETWYWQDMRRELHNYDTVIFEGSQGLLLDMDKGFFPHVTPSHTGLDNIPAEFLDGADVYLVTRSYTTRHGNGWSPRGTGPVKHIEAQKGTETNIHNEFQGEFKTGALDIPMLSAAWNRHCLDVWQAKYLLRYNLVITHADAFPKYGGPDKAVQVVHSEEPWIGSEARVNLQYILTPKDALLKMPFCNRINKLFANTDPSGNMFEIDPVKEL